MVLHWSLSDSKSLQVTRTRLRILAVLNNAVVWIVSTRPPISYYYYYHHYYYPYNYYYFYLFLFFLNPCKIFGLALVFHWSLCDSKSPRVSRTLLSILTDLNNAIVWIVSTWHHISKFFKHLTNPLRIVQLVLPSIIIIIIHSLELFTSAIADGFSFNSEWQQVSSSLQDT